MFGPRSVRVVVVMVGSSTHCQVYGPGFTVSVMLPSFIPAQLMLVVVMLPSGASIGGITTVSIELVAPFLMRGELVRVLDPWITGRLAMYAAMPSRKFIPQRTQAFIDYLVEHIRAQTDSAMAAMRSGAPAPRRSARSGPARKRGAAR